jgi:CRISPR system Cascade subunit CasA
MTLPAILAALARDDITNFPALRAHQRHGWHAFLVQLGAIALSRASLETPPTAEAAWCDLLRNLTPDFPDDEPWTLITASNRPAFLQPPIPSGPLAELKNRIATPDALDMLVTAKNHDLKQSVMTEAEAQDWVFALVTLQTMEGFLGAGNYGISRMNGGFANRAALSLAPAGGPSAHWRRDVHRLLALRDTLSHGIYAQDNGLALLWLEPWDGTASLRQDRLDVYYIEICRRVCLAQEGRAIIAYAGSSKAPRVAPLPGGATGDPWSPVVIDKDGSLKALTINGAGLGYRRMVEFLFSNNVTPSPLQKAAATDDATGVHIIARALVRGQGKTEGYHERRVPISRTVQSFFTSRVTDMIAEIARQRVELAGQMQNAVLKRALMALFQNGPDIVDARHDDSARKAEPFLRRFDMVVDRDFFPDLWAECDLETGERRQEERGKWVRKLFSAAEALLHDAEAEAARASRRRFRAKVRARDRLSSAVRFNDRLSSYFTEGHAP